MSAIPAKASGIMRCCCCCPEYSSNNSNYAPPPSAAASLDSVFGPTPSVPVQPAPLDVLALVPYIPTRFIDNNRYEDDIDIGYAGRPGPPPPYRVQYTPEYSGPGISGAECIRTQSDLTTAEGWRHDPDGYPVITTAQWEAAEWDGVTKSPNICTASITDVRDFIWPGNTDAMRGLRDLFYTLNPFYDVNAPTIVEIEDWDFAVLNHFRNLVDRAPFTIDPNLFYLSQWSKERKTTNYWETAPHNFPGTLDSNYGPCIGGTNAHCGWQFRPNATWQADYLMDGDPEVTYYANADAIFTNDPASNLPWSIKMSRILRTVWNVEGYSAHMEGIIRRPQYGLNWDCSGPDLQLRMQFRGTQSTRCP